MKFSPITLSVAIASVSTFAIFEAPAQAANLRNFNILTLGDSITNGDHGNDTSYLGAYRIQLQDELNDQFQNINFVGGRQTGPDPKPFPDFDLDHSGWGGYTLQGNRKGEKNQLLFVPELENENQELGIVNDELDMVLLMAGTNDFNSGDNDEKAFSDLSAVVAKITTNFTQAKVFVSTIVPIPGKTTEVDKFNERIRTQYPLANNNKDLSQRIYSVNAGGIVTTEQLADNIHPTEEGYTDIGAEWFKAIKPFVTDGVEIPDSNTNDNSDVTVPEPTSLIGLLAFGVLGAGATRKRQQKINGSISA